MVPVKSAAIAIGFCILFVSLASASTLKLNCGPKGELLSYQDLGGAKTISLTYQQSAAKQRVIEICDEFNHCYKYVMTEGMSQNLKDSLDVLAKLDESSQQESIAQNPHSGPYDLVVLRTHVLQQKYFSPESQHDINVTNLAQKISELRNALIYCQGVQENIMLTKGNGQIDDHFQACSIQYGLKGPNKGKQSDQYRKDSISEAVRLAILNGVDPYLMVALILMEKPPTIGSDYFAYRLKYGLLPVDGLPAFDLLGCLSPRNRKEEKYASAEQKKHYRELLRKSADLEKKLNSIYKKIPQAEMTVYYGLSDFGPNSSVVAQLREGKECPDFPEQRDSVNGKVFVNPGRPAVEKLICSSPLARDLLITKADWMITDAIKKLYLGSIDISDPTLKELTKRELECDGDCAGYLTPQKEIQTINVLTDNGPTQTSFMCSEEGYRTVVHGSPASFVHEEKADPLRCCVEVMHSASIHPLLLDEQFKSALGVKLIQKRIQDLIANGKDTDLAHAIQRYNGLGTVGATEKGNFDCIGGLNMDQNPIYGARTADLMINSIMNNPTVQRAVQDAISEFKNPVTSLFCLNQKAGPVEVDSIKYLEQQKKILLQDTPERAQKCAPYFR